MTTPPDDLQQRLTQHGQQHVLDAWETLDEPARQSLVRTLRAIDFAELARLYTRRGEKSELPERRRVAPLPRPQIDERQKQAYRGLAEEAFRAGEVAFLVVAGGQGSRLGFEQPKGMFPIGAVTNKSLFQIHAEKVLALRRRYGSPLPFLVMTSPATDADTRHYLADKDYFGLPPADVHFFCQGTMPALDLATGKLLLEAPGRLFLSPNGHGGTLTGLADSGLLERLRSLGVQTISYFQVDNPLTNLADLVFLGQHLAERAEISSKVLPKAGPLEKVGNVVLIDGRCSIIEYSDLPESWAREADGQGRPLLWAGNPAIHLFDRAFLERITGQADSLPWHLARKKVPFLGSTGAIETPKVENALKFERFIFDVLPLAERWTVLETDRNEEFAPVKNAEGVDSPASARQLMSNLAADWLRHAGIDVAVEAGNVPVPLEVSPLFALDADEFAVKVRGEGPIRQATYWGE